MADLLWDDVKCFFDLDLMGSLPDVRVPDASVEGWQAVLDLVAEKGWKCQYSEGGTVLPVPRAEAVLSRPADAECPDLRVWPAPDVLAIFRFHAADEVDFDVDLRELQDQARLVVFCGFLREIGAAGRAGADGPGRRRWPSGAWLRRRGRSSRCPRRPAGQVTTADGWGS